MKISVLLFLILPLFSFTKTSAADVHGRIIDKTTSEPVANALVESKKSGKSTFTDSLGYFHLELDAGDVVIVSASDFQTTEFNYSSGIGAIWNIEVESNAKQIGAVVITHDRLKEKLRESPVTVESLGIQSIKETPASDFYEALGHLKGVDITTASMGFKVINTRGFNSTSPVRSLQLIDGVDNQAPGLNFSLGNFLGASELDIYTTEIVVGASSAYYGPNAFNGVISMTTKSPWIYKGLSAQVKIGERELGQVMVRYANTYKNKKGRECYAFKANLFYMRAYDWEANNSSATSNSLVGKDNPGGYDAINRYGDELKGDNPSASGRRIDRSGLEYYYRTGYWEKELVNYNTSNLKTNLLFAYKFNDKNELQFATNFGTGSTVYQGDNRYRLEDVLFFQNRLEWIGKKGFLRAYATHEDAGKTYDIVLTSILLNDASKDNKDWISDYSTYWQQKMNKRVQDLDPWLFSGSTLFRKDWDSLYSVFLVKFHDSLVKFHDITRTNTDGKAQLGGNDNRERFYPGTNSFDSMKNEITSRRSFDRSGKAVGSRFFDRSALYHICGEKRFAIKDWKLTSGFSFRYYRPNSLGTLFLDTGSQKITNAEGGIYSGLEKRFWENRFKVNITGRLDKNVNFNLLFSPAVSVIYSKTKAHTYRVSLGSALRNPTLQDQYLHYNVGPAILLGNINGVPNVFTLDNWLLAVQKQNWKLLDTISVNPLKPEKVKTAELNYKGVLFKGRIAFDIGYYYSLYRNFIGYRIVVDGNMDKTTSFPRYAQVYRVASNSPDKVSTQGLCIGANYFFWKYFMLCGNWSWNKLDRMGSEDPLIPAFNTPRNKFNICIGGNNVLRVAKIAKRTFDLKNYGFNVNYKWVEGFRFEGSPQFTGNINSYWMLDAQISRNIPRWKSTLKIGAANLTNNKVYQVYGGPAIGRLAYLSLTYEP